MDNSTITNFWSHVDKTSNPNGCWEWTASKIQNGLPYGKFHIHRKYVSAHRFSWMIHKGSIPSGMLVCHKCDNPSCVNPNHLFLGTNKDNAVDRSVKGRGAINSRNGNSKLTDDKVLNIRNLYTNMHLSQESIAAMFGICQSQVSRIVRKVHWKVEA